MSSLSLRLPDSLHKKVRELAEQDHVSINQFIATAVAEKAAALLTVDYLEQRGRRADAGILDRLLRRVPDVPPTPGDELPAGELLNTPRRPTTRARARSKRAVKSRVQSG
jgi:predicted transcriptional regulator